MATYSFATLINLDVESDSYVQLGNAATNFGNANDVTVKNSGAGGTTRQGYLRFDLSSITDPIADVTLNLEVSLNNGGGSPVDDTAFAYTVTVFGLNNGDAGESWVEGNGGTDNNPAGEITWNNAPGNNTANNGVIAAAVTNLGSFITPALNPSVVGNPVPVSFTSQAFADFLNADADDQATLILVRTSSNGNNLAFASRERSGANGASLAINTIPEPSSALLLLFGGLLLRNFRRTEK